MEEIKPCPFCGCKEVEICRTNINACWVRCNGCGSDSNSNPTRKTAIEIWNNRPIIEGLATIVDDQDAEVYERMVDWEKNKK
jgi:Lar family restriction alleviation protein